MVYTMAMNIKDAEVERLAAEAAELSGQSKTAAVREALRAYRERLRAQEDTAEERVRRFHRFLEEEIWPHIPQAERGKPPMTKQEREAILGIGPDGV